MKCRVHYCHACCCYNVPFNNGELDKYKDRIVNPVLFTMPMCDAIVPFTDEKPDNNKCPFLRSDYKCNIYECRPDVCRKYGEINDLPCKWRKK